MRAASHRGPHFLCPRPGCAHLSRVLPGHRILASPNDRRGPSSHTKLAIEPTEIVANSLLAKVQAVGDTDVVQALTKEFKQLTLAGREPNAKGSRIDRPHQPCNERTAKPCSTVGNA